MLGAIIGDIVGSRFEFDRPGWTKEFRLFVKGCEFTDDTVMTIGVAEGLMNAGVDADEKTVKENLVKSMQKWGRMYPDVGYGARFIHWVFSDNPEPYNSLGMAISTHAGQNLGAGKDYRIREGFKKGILIALIFSLLMLPVMQFFGEPIISIFVDDPEVIRLGAKALQITSAFYFALGTIYVSRGILNGIGDAAFAFINGGVEMFGRIVFPLGIALLFPYLGVWGIWLSAGLTWFISGLFAMIRYYFKVCRKGSASHAIKSQPSRFHLKAKLDDSLKKTA